MAELWGGLKRVNARQRDVEMGAGRRKEGKEKTSLKQVQVNFDPI